MNTQIFKSTNGVDLIIKSSKSSIVFEVDPEQVVKVNSFMFQFTEDDYNQIVNYIEAKAYESWPNLTPKEATSLGSDYYEYYDKELDNNGYLSIRHNALSIDRPSPESVVLYRFNKKKMESFVHDLRRTCNVKI